MVKVNTFDVINLTKTYQRTFNFHCRTDRQSGSNRPAIDKLTFSLTDGLYGLLGPNGAGKSTLLNIVTGNLQQDKGKVLWNGQRTDKLGIKYRRVLGYMPQQQGLYPSFTGRRFLNYFCALKEIPVRQAGAEVLRVSQMVNLVDELDKRISAYSGGMKQRLLLASSLIGGPRLLILDEPTAGLDPKERVRMRTMAHSLSRECVVIIATHVVSDVETIADKIMFLKQGVMIDFGTPDDLIAKHAPAGGLEDVYISLYGDEADL